MVYTTAFSHWRRPGQVGPGSGQACPACQGQAHQPGLGALKQPHTPIFLPPVRKSFVQEGAQKASPRQEVDKLGLGCRAGQSSQSGPSRPKAMPAQARPAQGQARPGPSLGRPKATPGPPRPGRKARVDWPARAWVGVGQEVREEITNNTKNNNSKKHPSAPTSTA